MSVSTETALTSQGTVEVYRSIIKRVRESCQTVDVHVHASEVLFGSAEYEESQETTGLFALGKMNYTPLTWRNAELVPADREIDMLNPPPSKALQFFLRKTYYHTGPAVFRSILEEAGIDSCLVLPVAPRVGDADDQMDLLNRMFRNDRRFHVAGTVPNAIRLDDIEGYLLNQVTRYSIVAVKIHPNITGIDLSQARGSQRTSRILEACSSLGLPVIIHGGRSNHLEKSDAEFGSIQHLRKVGLNVEVPVIIAHGGAYGYSPGEVASAVLPVLKEILSASENVYIDISGLPSQSIKHLVSAVPTERIVFGSDALYHNPLMMEMRLLGALWEATSQVEDSFAKIVSGNPRRVLFSRGEA